MVMVAPTGPLDLNDVAKPPVELAQRGWAQCELVQPAGLAAVDHRRQDSTLDRAHPEQRNRPPVDLHLLEGLLEQGVAGNSRVAGQQVALRADVGVVVGVAHRHVPVPALQRRGTHQVVEAGGEGE